jgi:hypothetical protein
MREEMHAPCPGKRYSAHQPLYGALVPAGSHFANFIDSRSKAIHASSIRETTEKAGPHRDWQGHTNNGAAPA